MISSYLVVFKQSAVKLVLTGAVLGLVSCGGDDDKKPTPTPEPDTTPADFSLTLPQATYEQGAVATTEMVTITEIDTLTDISITSGGEYSIDSGSFTSSAGQIANNQTLVAKATAGSNFGDEVEITVTVGTVAKSFTVVTEAQDTTPEAFNFAAVTGAALSSEFVSAAVTITGINDAAPVSITGGEYSIDAGTYTNSAGSVTSGQSITVRLMSSSAFSTQSTATLNVGGVEAGFSVTTLAQDITPDAFSFVAVTDADFNTQYTSNVVTISGINDAAPISISNGEYSVNSGAYSGAAGSISNGDSVSVRLTSANMSNTAASAVLTIGGVEGSFTVTTVTDTTPPSANIAFPPPVAKTENSSLMVRGTTSDDLSAVTNVQIFVNDTDSGVEVTTDDNFATWSVQLPLLEGDNNIEVVVTDVAGNTNNEADTAYVLREEFGTAFPHEGVSLETGMSIDFDMHGNNHRAIVAGSVEDTGKFILIDLETGIRTQVVMTGTYPENEDVTLRAKFDEESRLIFTCNMTSTGTGISSVNVDTWELVNSLSFSKVDYPTCISSVVDRSLSSARLLVAPFSTPRIAQADIELTGYSIFSSNSVPDGEVPFTEPSEVYYAPEVNRIFAVMGDGVILELDPSAGARTEFSTQEDAIGDAVGWSSRLQKMSSYSNDGETYLVLVGDEQDSVLAVSAQNGERVILSPNDTENPLPAAVGIATHSNFGFALVQDTTEGCVYAIDLVSGQRVVFSKSTIN